MQAEVKQMQKVQYRSQQNFEIIAILIMIINICKLTLWTVKEIFLVLMIKLWLSQKINCLLIIDFLAPFELDYILDNVNRKCSVFSGTEYFEHKPVWCRLRRKRWWLSQQCPICKQNTVTELCSFFIVIFGKNCL